MFLVKDRTATIEHSDMEIEENVRLACKVLKPGFEKNEKHVKKLEYEKNLVSKIEQN